MLWLSGITLSCVDFRAGADPGGSGPASLSDPPRTPPAWREQRTSVMLLTLRSSLRRGPRGARSRPYIQELETRCLLSVATPAALLPEQEGNDTVDQAQPLGALAIGQPLGVSGQVGNSPAGGADVDFYSFRL